MSKGLSTAVLLLVASVINLAGSKYEVESLGSKGEFVLQGQIGSGNNKELHLAITDYLDNKGITISLDSLGNFSQPIPISGPLQEIYLYLDDVYSVPVVPNDTITMHYSEGILNLSGCTPSRDNDLKLVLKIHKELHPKLSVIRNMPYRLPDDSSRIEFAQKYSDYIRSYYAAIKDFEDNFGEPANREYFFEQHNEGQLTPIDEVVKQ